MHFLHFFLQKKTKRFIIQEKVVSLHPTVKPNVMNTFSNKYG